MTPDKPPVKIRNAGQAVDAILEYLREQKTLEVPAQNTRWREKTLYSGESQDYAVTSRLFTSGEWLIEIYQDVAPLSRTVYQVRLFQATRHYYWHGSIHANGEVKEATDYRILSEEESRKIANEILLKSKIAPPRPGGYGH